MSWPRFAYTLLVYALLPVALLRLLWRGRREPGYRQHWAERLGFFRQPIPQPIIWLHAVSVGETRAAAPLIKRLADDYPDHQILLTHMTPTGRHTGMELFGERVLRAYLPYDTPFTARRFLKYVQPRIGLIMETELWPNLIHTAHATGIPLLLVNARLSERSAARYARFPKLTQAALSQLAAIAAQSGADAQRLTTLGAREVKVCGNVKFDVAPPPEMLALGNTLRARIGAQRPVFLAASTRDGEEALILDSLAQLHIPGLLTLIVPRHPQRFGEVAALIQQRGFALARRSEQQPVAATTQVMLGDSMGELFAYYAACDVAFIGGSLLPFGGQNLIEACAAGCPVLIGPHTFNFSEAAEQALAAGCAQRVANVQQLAQEISRLLNAPAERARMAAAGRTFSVAHRGATDCIMGLVREFL